MWLVVLSDQLRIVGLGSSYLTNYLILRRLIQKQIFSFSTQRVKKFQPFCSIEGFILNFWVDSYVLLTRSLLIHLYAFNLHVLSLLLAFILGQDQTLLLFWKKKHQLHLKKFYTWKSSILEKVLYFLFLEIQSLYDKKKLKRIGF